MTCEGVLDLTYPCANLTPGNGEEVLELRTWNR